MTQAGGRRGRTPRRLPCLGPGKRGIMSRKVVLIACMIFREELEHLLAGELDPAEVEIVWLDAGLHAAPADLEQALKASLHQAQEASESAEIKVMLGQGCLPGISSLLNGSQAALFGEQNCITALLGEARTRELEQGNAMIMTPAWVRTWPENMKRVSGWNEVDFRINLGRYDRILVIDAGLSPLSDEEILEFFELAQVPIEVEAIDLAYFRENLRSLLA